MKTMTTEENKRMLALSCIIADVKAENMELEQRVQQLMDDYNEAMRQLAMQKRKDKDEDSAKQTLGEMRQMSDYCNKLERENEQLKKYASAIDSFMKEENLYTSPGTSCPYVQGSPAVASPPCLECDSFLRLIDGCGVVCRKVLEVAEIVRQKR